MKSITGLIYTAENCKAMSYLNSLKMNYDKVIIEIPLFELRLSVYIHLKLEIDYDLSEFDGDFCPV